MFVLIPRIGVHIDPEVLRYIFSNIQGEAGSKHAYPVCCQAGNLHMYCPFVYCVAGSKVSAFGTQPDRHASKVITEECEGEDD